MASLKRVACFYRVSTKGQLDGDDIPMQKRACREFADKQGWGIVKEYIEKGVSGYKVSEKDRDEIQRAKVDAENGLYDVLLCFMFDRLGRKQYETPLVMKFFAKKGIELWSVKEGQQKFDDHSDELINFIRFWQSSGESKKTSMRVDEKHEQMTKDGLYRGGKPPYGYKLEKSGIVNKKGKELFKLVVDDEQSKIIKQIFDMVYYEGYGSNRIVQYLNENGIPTYSGGQWNTGVVSFILRNPIYKGHSAYGKRKSNEGNFEMQSSDKWVLSEKPNEDLIIIEKEKWDRVQIIRSSRSPENVKKEEIERVAVTKSPLLFVGSIKCGHCGSPLTTTYNSKTYKLKDGTIQKWSQAKYRCSGKALGRTDCDGQTLYSKKKIEGMVLDEIDAYLEKLRTVDFTTEIDKYKKSHIAEDEKELKKMQKVLEGLYTELATLKNEVVKSLMGQSAFKPDMLNDLLTGKEKEIDTLNGKIQKAQEGIKSKNVEVSEMEDLKSNIPVWKEVFDKASHERKKMMLGTIIDTIIVYRDSIELTVKLNISRFIESVHGSEISVKGRAKQSNVLPYKFLENHFRIKLSA